MSEQKKETSEKAPSAEIKLDDLPKQLTEDEAKNVNGGRFA